MQQIELRIPARDGPELAATRFLPSEARDSVVIINRATATPRRFYRHFATALAAAGHTVISQDYRGIAELKVSGSI